MTSCSDWFVIVSMNESYNWGWVIPFVSLIIYFGQNCFFLSHVMNSRIEIFWFWKFWNLNRLIWPGMTELWPRMTFDPVVMNFWFFFSHFRFQFPFRHYFRINLGQFTNWVKLRLKMTSLWVINYESYLLNMFS